MRALVVGAGAFGAWTALWLRRRGADVTLVDQYGPGNSLASSGDETRVTRSAHGADEHYVRWQRRSLEHWRGLDPALFVGTGVAWFVGADDGFETASTEVLGRLGVPVERLTVEDAAARWPAIDLAGVQWVMHEPEAGALLARRAVAATVARFVAEGGAFRIGRASLGRDSVVVDVGGRPPTFDAVVFAAGPWLQRLLQPVVDIDLTITRQEVIYFATPPGDDRFIAANHPVWVEYGAAIYGLPSIDGRGFKVAPDWPGPPMDPDQEERRLSDAGVVAARDYLARRFPAMAQQPVTEGRVCQYELTADTHFVVDRLPALSMRNAWVVGGGSGHGFKHAPAVGEYLSGLVLDEPVGELAPPDDRFALRPRTAAVGMRTAGARPPTTLSPGARA